MPAVRTSAACMLLSEVVLCEGIWNATQRSLFQRNIGGLCNKLVHSGRHETCTYVTGSHNRKIACCSMPSKLTYFSFAERGLNTMPFLAIADYLSSSSRLSLRCLLLFLSSSSTASLCRLQIQQQSCHVVAKSCLHDECRHNISLPISELHLGLTIHISCHVQILSVSIQPVKPALRRKAQSKLMQTVPHQRWSSAEVCLWPEYNTTCKVEVLHSWLTIISKGCYAQLTTHSQHHIAFAQGGLSLVWVMCKNSSCQT